MNAKTVEIAKKFAYFLIGITKFAGARRSKY